MSAPSHVAKYLLEHARRGSKLLPVQTMARELGDADAVLRRALQEVRPFEREVPIREVLSMMPHAPASADSDDIALWIAAQLMALGYEVRMVLARQASVGYFHHVFVEARRPGKEAW